MFSSITIVPYHIHIAIKYDIDSSTYIIYSLMYYA